MRNVIRVTADILAAAVIAASSVAPALADKIKVAGIYTGRFGFGAWLVIAR